MDYKKEIIEAVQQIQSEFTLKHLLGIIKSLVRDEVKNANAKNF